MGKYLVSMRYLISTICIVLLLWGCDRTVDAATQPKVVRKKIVAQKGQTAKVRTNQTVRNAKTNQAARLEKKTAAVKTDRQTRVAKKVEVIPARNTVTKPAKQKKPAVRPRSDISETQLASTDDSAAPSDKLIAATSNVTSKVRSVAIPATYDALGKIDPFEPLFREKAVSVKKKKKKKRQKAKPTDAFGTNRFESAKIGGNYPGLQRQPGAG